MLSCREMPSDCESVSTDFEDAQSGASDELLKRLKESSGFFGPTEAWPHLGAFYSLQKLSIANTGLTIPNTYWRVVVTEPDLEVEILRTGGLEDNVTPELAELSLNNCNLKGCLNLSVSSLLDPISAPWCVLP